MSIHINCATNVTYVNIALKDVSNVRNLYLSAITSYNQGDVINVIKSNEVLHIVFKDADKCKAFLTAYFPNWYAEPTNHMELTK